MEPLHLVAREIGAGGIVRIGEEDDTRLGRHRLEERVDIRREIMLGRGHGLGARGSRGDRIHEEAVAAVEDFVAGTRIGLGQKTDQLVRAVSTDDPFGIEPIVARERPAERLGAAVGVAMDLRRQRRISSHCPRTRAQRALVRRKPDRPGKAGYARLSGRGLGRIVAVIASNSASAPMSCGCPLSPRT